MPAVRDIIERILDILTGSIFAKGYSHQPQATEIVVLASGIVEWLYSRVTQPRCQRRQFFNKSFSRKQIEITLLFPLSIALGILPGRTLPFFAYCNSGQARYPRFATELFSQQHYTVLGVTSLLSIAAELCRRSTKNST